jgi:hypothetical protein
MTPTEVEMLPIPEVLTVQSLNYSGITAALHVVDKRTTLELFAFNGQLLYGADADSIAPLPVAAVWTVSAESHPQTMVAVGLVAPGCALPNVVFSHRRRKVRASLHRIGPFWLAEAEGRRLRLRVDDGLRAITAAPSSRPGTAPRTGASRRLFPPFQETP